MSLPLDHLVWAAPDLERAVEEFRERTGVLASPGGQHAGLGTRNFLVALGEAEYLEIIGPDLEQDEPPRDRPFGIDQLEEPRLVAWAVKAGGLEARVLRARENGWDPGPAVAMSRKRPDGVLLEWQLTVAPPGAGGARAQPVPFLIDWGKTPSPAQTATAGSGLERLWAEHPDPPVIEKRLAAVEAKLEVEEGAEPRLMARLVTPRGTVVLD